jgi:hypothetical protein
LLIWSVVALLPAGHVSAQDQGQATVLATVRVNPLVLSLELPDHMVKAGQTFDVGLRLTDRQATDLQDVDFGINLDEGPCLRVNGTKTQHRGRVRAGDGVAHYWRVKVLKSASNCAAVVVVATATAIDRDTGELLVAVSQAKVLTLR